ncbi:MAG: major facilitator superfamily 1 [Rhodospirillales bacterium]|nr:major facilitator superfamily 1 [Rhodospirillales bacterium]
MSESPNATPAIAPKRWLQLGLGIICMSMIANLQYGWTLFVDPIDQRYGWGRAAIQIAFSVFVFTETWLVPIEGWFVDRYGPRIVVMFGGVLVAAAWLIDSFASSLAVLYVGAVVAGVGAGAVYGTCVGNALKWFPDRRGLAAGATAAGFGAGAALTVIPIAETIEHLGYQTAFLTFGLGQGSIILLIGWFLRAPGKGAVAASTRRRRIAQTGPDLMPALVLRQPVFWLMYLMFVLVASGGLMAAAQIGPIARDYGIASVPLDVFGLVMPALTLAISLDRILDGFGRPFFGWVSDNIGRENTMFIAFAVAATSLLLLTQFGHSPWMFVVMTALFFGVFGEIYSIFPATCGDTFGSKYAATNAGMLYTAKGTASALVPLASLAAATYGWSAVFTIAVIFNFCAAFLALFALKPVRARHLCSGSSERGDAIRVVVGAAALVSEPAPAMGFAAESKCEVAAERGDKA